jgi:hypothetical protein
MTPAPTPSQGPTAKPPIDARAYGKELVRYVSPLVVGYAVTWAAKAGLKLNPTTAYAQVAPVVSAAYYAAISFAEKKIPVLGRLLGAVKPESK